MAPLLNANCKMQNSTIALINHANYCFEFYLMFIYIIL
jgi:hypothetical protein